MQLGAERPLMYASNFNAPTSRAAKVTSCDPSLFAETVTSFTGTPLKTGFILSGSEDFSDTLRDGKMTVLMVLRNGFVL